MYDENTGDKWRSTLSHEKALYNVFISCLNLRKMYGNFQSSENFGNTLKSVSEGFLFFLKLFGNVLKFWENFEIGS